MNNNTSRLAFAALLAIGAVFILPLTLVSSGAAMLLTTIWLSGSAIASTSIKMTASWERALIFRRGKYLALRGPGAFLVIPLVDQVRIIDNRIRITREPR